MIQNSGILHVRVVRFLHEFGEHHLRPLLSFFQRLDRLGIHIVGVELQVAPNSFSMPSVMFFLIVLKAPKPELPEVTPFAPQHNVGFFLEDTEDWL